MFILIALGDPGIPKGMPFEAAVKKDVEMAKEKILVEKLQRREEAKARRQLAQQEKSGENADTQMEFVDEDPLAKLAKSAVARQHVFATGGSQISSATDPLTPDVSKRAYYNTLVEVCSQSDLLLQVLDIRDPLAMYDASIDQVLLSSASGKGASSNGKTMMIVLNKADLVDEKNATAWFRYFSERYPTVLFSNAPSKNSNAVGSLMAAIKKTRDSSSIVGTKPAYTVGVVGYPNVGKSSLINALKQVTSGSLGADKKKACASGALAGITKHIQKVKNICCRVSNLYPLTH